MPKSGQTPMTATELVEMQEAHQKSVDKKAASTFDSFSKYIFEKNKQLMVEHLNEVLIYGSYITNITIDEKGIVELKPIPYEDIIEPFAICESKT
jgi:hypothetical protein